MMKCSLCFVCVPVLFAMPVSGQDMGTARETGRSIEEIVVVGSRARLESQADELPVPVDVQHGLDLAHTGEIDLGAALTKLAPSFNYTRLSVGDGALLNAATLRGLAPDQTLVLVNGKRRHSMAWVRVLDGVIGYGTGGTDLRAIPSAAVARVEVLRDGAAAQYGSDAIAGVINVALKEDTGGEVIAHVGRAAGADATRFGMSFNAGMSLGADGFLNVTGEWYDSDPLQRNGGNGGHDPDYQDELITFSSPSHGGSLLFANAALPVGDAAELYAFGGASRREGRSSGAYRFRYNYWQGVETGDATWDFVVPNFINFHERNTHPVYPDGFLPYEESEIRDISVVAGWRGRWGEWDLDLSAGYGRNNFDFAASDTINASVGAHYLERNPGASVADIIANAGPLSGDSGGIEFDQLTLNLDLRRTFELTAVGIGLERRAESYGQKAGDEAAWSCGLPHVSNFSAFAVGPDGSPIEGTIAACGFQGYPGYSPRNAELSEDDRESWAAYGELEVRPGDALSLGLALRSENYSDAGAKVTGKLAARLELTGTIALRGAISTGFRAPSLSQRRFNSILFVGSDEGLTTTFSANEGHAIARAFGVEALQHETSRNWSAGIVGQWPESNVRITADVYSTDIGNRVVRSQGIACAGIPACDAEQAGTAAFFFNGVSTRTRGFDVSASWGLPAAGGYLWISANGHSNKTEITDENLPAGAPAGLSFGDYFGGWAADLLERGQPRTQANLSADWRHDTWGALLRVNHFGETVQHPIDTGMVTVEADNTVDVEAWFERGPFQAAFGVNNLFDALPTELDKTHLSNVLWGIRYPTDTPYGLAGRFAYLRLIFGFGR
ncbi:MAG: TonB-dependent receptor [Gammaproteobacteria bacterium]|nr:TonB-dependent receptor [Gammaproteobacteria bacterium]